MEKPAPPDPQPSNSLLSLLAIFLASSLALLVCVVLSFLTMNYFLPVLVVGGGVFLMVGFHYVTWGWWLSHMLPAEDEEPEARPSDLLPGHKPWPRQD